MYFGRNHGDCMLVMPLDGNDALFVGDLVTPYSVGLGFCPDYYPGDYLRPLKEIEALMDAVRVALEQGDLQGDALYRSIELPEEFQRMRCYRRNIARAAERIAYYYGMGW